MPLSLRFALIMGLALTATLGLALMLALAKFNTTLQTITDDRRQTVSARLASEIESGLDIGLTLTEFSGLRGNIQRLMARDGELIGVALVDASGEIMMAVGKGFSIGNRIDLPPEHPPVWMSRADQQTIAGRLVYTAYGQLRAGILLRFTDAGTDSTADDLPRSLWLIALFCVLIVSVMLIAVGRYAFQPLEAVLSEAASQAPPRREPPR